MKRILVSAVFAVFAACTPDIPNVEPADVVVARFDPSAVPAVVPSPNDLATNPATGTLAVPVPADASGADKAFYEWLNTLNGFPAAATASATFSADLDPASVTAQTVRVFDLDDSNAAVTSTLKVTPAADPAFATLSISPPTGGWTGGHRYAVAIIGGANGVKGASGLPVVGSATWAFLRASKPLVTCEDLSSADCRPTTEIIPSNIKDDQARRLEDQTASAKRLEQLRRKYAPAIEFLVSGGVKREDIALLWSFKIANAPTFLFNPAGTPPQVPTPNDLAISNGKVNAPVDPSSSPANQEFTTDYLNTLNGFPVSATASALVVGGIDVDPATVNDSTVKVMLLTPPGTFATPPSITYDTTKKAIVVTPPNGSWGRANKIAIAVLGGANGVKGTNGVPLAASDAWALARSAATLVDCATLGPGCKSVVKAAPITDLQAIGLEGLRRGYKPVLDALGVPRAAVSGLWVFSTVNQPEVTFNLAATPIIPFPSNQFLRTADDNQGNGRLAFPPMAGQLGALFAGLNTLDGFSTTSMIVSENSATAAALDEGTIDAATLAAGTGFAKLEGAGPLMPQVQTCLDCASSTGMMAQPQQLQWVPQRPLEPLTRYAAYVTTELKDSTGRNVMPSSTFALVRLKNPLVDMSGKSTVPVVSDVQANALEAYRLKFKNCLDLLEMRGIERKKIALGFCVTTQSTTSVLRTIAGTIAALPANVLPDSPTMLVDATTPVKLQMTAAGIPSANIDRIFAGNLVLPFGLNGTGGTLNPDFMGWTARKAPFFLMLPTGTAPMSGWPVAIFGHGLTRSRNDTLAIANTLATAGFAVVAIDVVFHGDRATCVGSTAATMQMSDDAACADPTTQRCDAASGRCIARDQTATAACNPAGNGDAVCFAAGQGQCQLTGKCEGGDFRRNADGNTSISAWNYLNLVNLFATRDNFRYTGSVDFATLVRMIRSTAATSLNAQLALASQPQLNGNVINYVGQSLGTFNGAVFAAASPAATNMAFNVAGADQVEVLLTAPAFAAQRTGFLGGLAALGLTPGTPGFDQFIVLARTIMDPSDPQNLIYDGVHSTNANRKIYIQYIDGDQVLPNTGTEKLIAAATQDATRQAQVFKFLPHSGTAAAGFFPMSYPLGSRHGFLLNPANNSECNPMTATCATVVAQSKIATFLVTGTAP